MAPLRHYIRSLHSSLVLVSTCNQYEEEDEEEEERCGALSRLRLKQATTFITSSEIVYRLVPYLDTFGRLNDRRNDVKVQDFFYHL